MMEFLRKYQKVLFIVIAVMTVASFMFMGGSRSGMVAIEDKKVGQTVSGKAIYERDLKALIHFLALGSSDVFSSDLIETGAFLNLAEKYFPEIQADFEERLSKARLATFYNHPQAPFLNAVQVWNRFSPQLVNHYQQLLSGNVDAKTFSVYAKLYMDQQTFPPELLATLLFYEQQNYSWITPDPKLHDPRSLALFGYQSFEEWFGPRFSDVVAKFILNCAAIAEKKGYKVTLGEARSEFSHMCYKAARMKSMKEEVTDQDLNQFVVMQLQIAGVDESRAVQLWKKVMLMHRYFEDLGQGVLVDPLPYQQFVSFADAKATVDVYELPEVLKLKDFRSMLKVQYYLDAISPKSRGVDLPRTFYSIEEIEKRCPQIVTSHFELEVAKVTGEQLASRISLKQLWDFEVSDAGWSVLIQEYPILNKKDSEKSDARELILDGLDKDLRKKVDRLAIQTLLKEHPEWLKEAFQSQPMEKCSALIRSKGSSAPFNDVEETSSLIQALQKAQVGETIQFAAPKRSSYYAVKVLNKPEKKEVMSLQAALQGDAIDKLLDEKLESALPEARKKENPAFKGPDGSWRPFHEVRDDVGAYVYADLLKQISSEELRYEEYASKRFEKMMNEAKRSIQKENNTSHFMTEVGNVLSDQWKVKKRVHELRRSDTTYLPKNEIFAGKVGSWSSVATSRGGDVAFAQLIQLEKCDLKIEDEVTQGQKLIGRELMAERMTHLIDEVGLL